MGSGSSKASSAGPSRVPANKQPLQREQKESTQPNRQAASAPNGQPNRQPVSVSDQKENTNTTSNKQQISLPKNSTEVENGRPSIIKEKSMQFNEARKRISSAVSRKANVQKRFSRGFSMAKIQATKDKCTDNPVLLGDISKPIPPTAKIVRIFTSSTFTDTKYERNSWMVNSYPKIQSFCRDHGYDFQVVDMRWGVRDEATDDHSVLDLCLRELEQCQKLSTGPNFVCLLSHRYGYRNLLKQIEAKEFEQLLPAITSAEDKDLLNKWYKRDDNAVPPVYVLQRISTLLPDFVSKTNKEDRDKAKADWWTDSDKMQDLLASAAEKCLGPEKSRNYLVSVTEREIQRGLLEVENQDTTCMWFKRNLLGIEGDRQSNSLSRYIDFSGEEEKWKKSRQLLSELKDEKMSKALPENNIVTYNVKWISGGIDPEVKEHSQYLNKISEDLVTNMQQMIDTAIKAREKQEMVEPILEECKQQIMFCQHKSNGFRGRDDILQKIKSYVTGRSQNPLVVHGSSGCGKTSIIAMATKLTKTSWLKQAAVVCRFLGTTPDSSTIGPLLKSLILQIRKIYGQETGLSGEGIEDLKEEFVASLELPFGNAPLIIFLDSLDQLDPANGARGVSWLPTEFSENVKIVVSTLVDRQYEAFPKLKAALPDDDSFIDVPVLSVEDAESIIKSWLESQNRTLTSKQNDIVVKAFNEYPLALYLKLSLNEACQWSSFSPPDQTVLQNTVRKSIDTLFHQLEVRYGNLFVSRTLGYLTVALNGLSESELEDILSCDDDVLNDVYQYWTPPTRRSPPLLLVRLKTDLDQYLVDRGADGMRVIYWYHRQFIEAAMDIYCTEKNQKILHSALADFFAGIWSNGNKKPFVNNKNKKGSEDRLVTAQPLMFKDKYNFRKLGHQPYHRIKAGQLDLVKSECLCNFKFLQTKLIAMTYRRVFMDLNLARNTFESDKELAWIADAFRLSEYALSHDPYQLAPHIIDRLSKEKVVSKFVEQCKQSDFPYLASSDEVLLKPGGELIYTMTGHTSSVNSLDVMADGSMAVTCGQYGDDVIRTWSLKKGKLVKEYENLPRDPEKVYFVDKDKKILIHYRSSVVVISISDNKQFTQEISHMCQLCVCGPNRSIFGTFLIRDCNFYSVIDGTVKNKLTCDGNKNLFDIQSIISATTNYVALTHATEDEFYVINLATKDLSISKRETSGKFSVDAIVITYSEKTVICASFLESTIRLHDINTLNIIKTIQTRDDPYEEISNFHVTKDGKCLYFPCYRDVIMIDLKNETETKKFRSHPDSITDVQIFSNDKAVSITQDSIVRIWDMAESAKTSETDCSLMDHRIVEFRPLPNCRHVVILGNPKATVTDDYYMYVYDLVDKCIVQSTELDEGSHIVEAIDDNTVLVLPMSLKPKTIDLKTMTIKTVFQGKVCERCKSYKMAKGGKEFMCLSRGRKNIKVYKTATGKVIKILKSPKEGDYRIDSFFTNRDGSVIVAKADETFIIFDVNDGKTTTVTASNLKMEIIGNVCSVSPNGNYVVLSACKVETTEVWDSEPMAFLWNVKKAKMAYQLIDSEYMMNYKKSDAPVTVALDEVRFLDDEKIVSSHDDFIIRVWSTETGGLLHRLTGHTKQAMLSVPDGGPYFLSYGFMGEEVIKLWDRTNFQCISSFTLDTTVGKLRFCGDNETFITSTKNPVNLIYWSLHGREPAKPLHKYPKLQRKNYNIQLEIETEEDSVEDGDDPDTDLEELEESDDEFSDPEY